jgi:hypothetical protein
VQPGHPSELVFVHLVSAGLHVDGDELAVVLRAKGRADLPCERVVAAAGEFLSTEAWLGGGHRFASSIL